MPLTCGLLGDGHSRCACRKAESRRDSSGTSHGSPSGSTATTTPPLQTLGDAYCPLGSSFMGEMFYDAVAKASGAHADHAQRLGSDMRIAEV